MASKMSLLSRQLLQSSLRKYSAAAGSEGHAGAARKWKLASFLVAFPAVLLCMVNAYLSHEHYHPPPFVAYEHMRRREKRFPWGDGQKSLFHNPAVNALPNGYEFDHDD